MLNFQSSHEELWNEVEKKFPGIKDKMESSAVMMKLSGNPEAYVKINFGYTSVREPLVRCHIYKAIGVKVFTLYHNVTKDNTFVRNQISSLGKLQTYAERIPVESNEQLESLLKKLVLGK